MSVLSDNYKRIVSEIEEKMTNKEDLEFVKEKVAELSMLFMDIIDNLADKTEEKMRQMEEKQKQIEAKMEAVESAINEIEGDIYEEDGNFDFEIVCPYCNYEFTAEITGKDEITCPECNNIIELDWNEEDEDSCTGHCSNCHGCEEDEDDFEDDEMDHHTGHEFELELNQAEEENQINNLVFFLSLI